MGDVNAADTVAETFGFWQTEEYMPAPAYNVSLPKTMQTLNKIKD